MRERPLFALILAAKTLRTFCYGALGVLFPVYLAERGFGALGLGAAVTLTLAASAAITFLVRRPAERYGARRLLMILAGMIAVSAVLFLFAEDPWIVVIAAMIGNLAVGTGEAGPFPSLEQVLLARTASREELTGRLSLYNVAGFVSAAFGAAFMGYRAAGPPNIFFIFLASGIVQALLYSTLAEPPKPPARRSPSGAASSSPFIRRIAALFALDSFAGGFILQSFVLYWFQARFGLDIAELGWISFGSQLLSGLSFLSAAPLSRRFGHVNTMVVTHLVANVLLITLAFAPSAMIAVPLLLARHLLSQIDVPTRQAFLMLAVSDDAREEAATLTNMSRTLAQAASPVLAGWAMQALSLGVPFVVGGAVKIVYDLLLFAVARKSRID